MPRKRKGVTAAQQRERLRKKQDSSNNDTLRIHGESEVFSQQPDVCKVTSGTLHQGHTRFQNPGVQCAYISLMALIRMTLKDPKSWTSDDIDECVIDGDSSFVEHCETLGIQPKMLMASELPRFVRLSQTSFVCNQSDRDIEFGLLNPILCDVDECNTKGIDKVLLEKLTDSPSCLLFCGGLTIALAKVENSFYTFDPHSRGKDGMLDPMGTAVMIAFAHLKDLVCYIEKLFLLSLKLAPSHQFELVPINIAKHENLLEACTDNTKIIANTSSKESMEKDATVLKPSESYVQMETNSFDASESMKSYFEDQRHFKRVDQTKQCLKRMNI